MLLYRESASWLLTLIKPQTLPNLAHSYRSHQLPKGWCTSIILPFLLCFQLRLVQYSTDARGQELFALVDQEVSTPLIFFLLF